jgi:site-specific DNA recombinase
MYLQGSGARNFRVHSAAPMSGALIYLRVSTKKQDQRNELNLPAQQKRCEDWCKSESIPVLKVFSAVGESAWKTERPTLDEAMAFIKESKGKVTHFVVQDTSRFSRNDEVKAMACALLRRMDVRLVSVDEPALDDSPAGKMLGTVMTGLAEFYSHSLSSRVRYRFQVHREQGRWLHQAPIGYRNVQQGGMKNLVPDESAPLIRQCFDMVASGAHSSDYVRKLITAAGLRTKKGHKLGKQSFSYTLKNPLYCGLIVHKGKTYKGTFEPLVSEEIWQSAQNVLRGKKRAVPKKLANESFPLRGFVKCGYCNAKLTAGNVRGRNKTYPKYWCYNTKCEHPVSVSAEKIEAHWLEFLERMQPAFETLVTKIPVLAKAKAHKYIEDAEQKQRQLSSQLADKRALHLKLIEAKLKDELSKEDFDTMKVALLRDIAEIEAAERAVVAEVESYSELTAEKPDTPLARASEMWVNAHFNDKLTVQNVLFPYGLCYRTDISFFAQVTNELEAVVYRMLIQLAEQGEAFEVLDGRDDWI